MKRRAPSPAETKARDLFDVSNSSTVSVNASNGSVRTEDAALYEDEAQGHPQGGEHLIGPSVGPSDESTPGQTLSAPQSPYSAGRAIIRDLTLPTVPNLEIPGSPVGSPPPGMNKKFSHFLELKIQGIHFNEKLARSSALKNPSLLHKLLEFAGVPEDEQYATTLPEEIWNPAGFPAWAYKEDLAKSQQEIHKKREEERLKVQRENIEFVSASVSGQSSRSGTPGSSGVSKGLRGSAAERVMAGLDRSRVKSPQIANLTARGYPISREGKSNDRDGRWKARSRSPTRRKRSRSR